MSWPQILPGFCPNPIRNLRSDELRREGIVAVDVNSLPHLLNPFQRRVSKRSQRPHKRGRWIRREATSVRETTLASMLQTSASVLSRCCIGVTMYIRVIFCTWGERPLRSMARFPYLPYLSVHFQLHVHFLFKSLYPEISYSGLH